MRSFNHESDHVKWGHIWPQCSRVKCRIGAANSSKKPIKNREVETLPAGSGNSGNVPTVSGSWAKNGEPWTLGGVSARICAGDRTRGDQLMICRRDTVLLFVNTTPQRDRISVPELCLWEKNQRCAFYANLFLRRASCYVFDYNK